MIMTGRLNIIDTLDHISDAFIALDSDMNFIHLNKVTETVANTAREELIGKCIWTVFPQLLGTSFYKAHIEALEKNRQVTVEDFYVPLNMWLEARVFPTDYGLAVYFRNITEQKLQMIETTNSKEFFRTILESAAMGIALVNLEGRPVKCNKAFIDMIGYSEEELTKMKFSEFTYPEDAELDLNLFGELKKKQRSSYQIEKRYVSKSGNILWGRLTVSLILDSRKEPQYAIGMVEDITEWKETQEKLYRTQKTVSNILSSISDCFFSLDENWNIIYVNEQASTIMGKATTELKGKNLWEEYGHAIKADSSFCINFRKAMKDKKPVVFEEYFPKFKRWFSIHAYPADSVLSIYLRDITETKKLTKKLEQLSSLDGLTGINNRRTFNECLEKEWSRSCRSSSPLSLIMVDIDYFKAFNDTYGHLGGDSCLVEVANTLKGVLRRPGDFVARFGGEEFAVVLPDTPESGAKVVAERLREAIAALRIPHTKSRVASFITISLGISTMVPSIYSRPYNLIEKSDKALYQAKVSGRNRISVYNIS